MSHLPALTQILADVLAIDPSAIQPDSTFDSLGADSLDQPIILLAIENHFQIQIEGEDETLSSVPEALALITRLAPHGSPAQPPVAAGVPAPDPTVAAGVPPQTCPTAAGAN